MKKMLLLLAMFCSVTLLTACGVRVTSETEFNLDGSGTRDIAVTVSDLMDQGGKEEDLKEIDRIIQAAAPDGMNYSRAAEEEGDIVYHFLFSFSDIEDYQEKVSRFSGNSHEASWYTEESIFKADIAFREEECSYDIVKWAVKALEEGGYRSVTSLFSSYELNDSVFYLEGKEMFRGMGNPSFEKEMAPGLEEITMYSDFESNREPEKRLVLQFEEGELEQINRKAAKALLDQWTEDYKMDTANGQLVLSLKGEEAIRTFLGKADPAYTPDRISYSNEETMFRVLFELTETYSIRNFLEQFQLKTQYIRDYISLPDLRYDEVAHLSTVSNQEEEEGYRYKGAYRYDMDYYMHAISVKEAVLSEILAEYTFGGPLSGEKKVTLRFEKNGCDLTKIGLKDYYAAAGLEGEAVDYGDYVTISFWQKIKKDGEAVPALEKRKRESFRTHVYECIDQLSVEQYVPVLDGYTVNTERQKGTCVVQVSETAAPLRIQIGEELYTGGQLEERKQDGVYRMEGKILRDGPTEVTVWTQEKALDVYIWMVILATVLFVAAFGAGYYYFRVKKQGKKEETGENRNDETGI